MRRLLSTLPGLTVITALKGAFFAHAPPRFKDPAVPAASLLDLAESVLKGTPNFHWIPHKDHEFPVEAKAIPGRIPGKSFCIGEPTMPVSTSTKSNIGSKQLPILFWGVPDYKYSIIDHQELGNMGVSENKGFLFFLWSLIIIRILPFRVLYWGPYFRKPPHDPSSALRSTLAQAHVPRLCRKSSAGLPPSRGF